MDDEKEARYAAMFATQRAVSEIKTAISEAAQANCDVGVLGALQGAMEKLKFANDRMIEGV